MAEHIDFLEIHYSEMGFLINRNQFSSSIMFEKRKRVRSRLVYFNTVISYKADFLIAFDMDYFLQSHFKCNDPGELKLALIVNINTFNKKNMDLLRKIFSKSKISLSPDYIAITAPSQSTVKSIPLDEIKLMPHLIRNTLFDYGLLGCRFFDPGNTYYFIDIEGIIFYSLYHLVKKEKV